jgi:phosphatidate cytidylyltransferase
LKQRMITGVLAGAVFLTILYLGGYWFSALITLMSFVGFYEYVRMNRLNSRHSIVLAGYAGLLYLVFPWKGTDWISLPALESLLWMIMFFLFSMTVLSKNEITIDQISLLFIGIVYIGIGFHYMIETRILEHGFYWTMLIFSCIWAADAGAYFTGMAFGKRPLWPAISPKKTVEGAVGGVLLSVVVAFCFSLYAPEWLSFAQAMWIGLVAAVIGQIGDLIQSAYKRVRNMKDTGSILPGHGGVLDRTDSWLIVFPFVHFLSLIPQ